MRLAQMVEERPTLEGAELGRLVRPGKEKKPQEWVIWQAPRKMGFSRKKGSFRADEKDRKHVKERYRPFTKKAKKTDPGRLVFLDETGIDRSQRSSTAWARLGEHAQLTRFATSIRRSRTVMGAMRASGLVAMRSAQGGMKKGDFLGFLRESLCPRLEKSGIVVVDNLDSYHSKETIDLIRAQGASVAFLPPYSPELNPIEML